MISSLFILSETGDIIIEKHWRGVISRSVCDYFWDQKLETELNSPGNSTAQVLPVIVTPKYYLVNIHRPSIYLLAAMHDESPPLLVIDFMQRIYDIFVDYFGKTINETVIRDNFVHVYQLLDEMADNGFPFTTEPNFLLELIKPPNVVSNIIHGVTGSSAVTDILPSGSLGAITWRKTGIKYTRDEIFFDIVEEIDCIVDSNGMVVTCEINGEIMANSRLTGMPDLTLTFNNPRILDDVSFHPCVRHSKWENDRVLSFVPPDGNFKLMSYRIKGITQMPIYVKPQISYSNGGARVNVMVGQKVGSDKSIESVFVNIPFPKSVSAINLTANVGSHIVEDSTKTVKWDIGKIPKDKTPMLTGNVNLTPGQPIPESNPSIMVQFKIVMYAISGIGVNSLSCSEKYKPYKGVRCITKAGKFQVRC
ncbi:hypothetical protein SAMD00019534_122160, partial [Acytostelium subglobosum LB1]|uniref:hypothetical protein n=1 Tax=Acytostelium subglobosum LB1 TaxID=1410327 RepID=UPI000644CD17